MNEDKKVQRNRPLDESAMPDELFQRVSYLVREPLPDGADDLASLVEKVGALFDDTSLHRRHMQSEADRGWVTMGIVLSEVARRLRAKKQTPAVPDGALARLAACIDDVPLGYSDHTLLFDVHPTNVVAWVKRLETCRTEVCGEREDSL